MNITHRNHYVPIWYQNRFISSEQKEHKYYYLDLKPEKIIHQNGRFHLRKNVRYLGPASCFYQDHLYTLFFGANANDVVEKFFLILLIGKALKQLNYLLIIS